MNRPRVFMNKNYSMQHDVYLVYPNNVVVANHRDDISIVTLQSLLDDKHITELFWGDDYLAGLSKRIENGCSDVARRVYGHFENPVDSKTCTCDFHNVLMRYGCQCGGK